NKKGITPAEPLGDIHMPNGSIIPIFISLGFFIASFGAIFRKEAAWGDPVLIIGLAIAFGSMLARSLKDDHGFHIPKSELMDEEDDKKGVKAQCMLNNNILHKHGLKNPKEQRLKEKISF